MRQFLSSTVNREPGTLNLEPCPNINDDVILSKLDWIKGRESEVQHAHALGVAVVHYRNLNGARELGVTDGLELLLQKAGESVGPQQ